MCHQRPTTRPSYVNSIRRAGNASMGPAVLLLTMKMSLENLYLKVVTLQINLWIVKTTLKFKFLKPIGQTHSCIQETALWKTSKNFLRKSSNQRLAKRRSLAQKTHHHAMTWVHRVKTHLTWMLVIPILLIRNHHIHNLKCLQPNWKLLLETKASLCKNNSSRPTNSFRMVNRKTLTTSLRCSSTKRT